MYVAVKYDDFTLIKKITKKFRFLKISNSLIYKSQKGNQPQSIQIHRNICSYAGFINLDKSIIKDINLTIREKDHSNGLRGKNS